MACGHRGRGCRPLTRVLYNERGATALFAGARAVSASELICAAFLLNAMSRSVQKVQVATATTFFRSLVTTVICATISFQVYFTLFFCFKC